MLEREKLASGRETLGHHMNVTMLGANPSPNIKHVSYLTICVRVLELRYTAWS